MTLKRVPVRSRRDIPLRIGDSTPSRNVVAVAAPDNLRFSVPGDFIRYGDDGVVSEDETSRLPAEVDLLTSVRCPDLTKVSLLTSDEELYKSLCSDRLWELLSTNGEPLLCRVGDKLPGHQDLLVADCEPTKQGLLTPETQVVVVKGEVASVPEPPSSAATGALRIHVLSREREVGQQLDCLLLAPEAMSARNLSNGAWVWLALQDQPWVRQAMVSEYSGTSADTVLMSPHLWFHLRRQPSPLVCPNARLRLKACNSTPPYATEFHLTAVHSPRYSSQLDLSAALREHFAQPRYLCKGDIVTVRIPGGEADFTERSPVAFFRVSQIQGPSGANGFICQRDETRLYQAGSTRSYVPQAMSTYYSELPPHTVWDNPHPPHLAPSVDTLQNILLPYLHSSALRKRVPPCLLLSGCPGSGKSTVVSALSLCLGLHLCRVGVRLAAAACNAATYLMYLLVSWLCFCLVPRLQVEY